MSQSSTSFLQKFSHPGTLRTVLIISVLTVLLRDQPGVSVLFVPFRTFDAFIHESGHALVCVLTGGTVNWIKLGLGGVTDCDGGNKVAIALAGYITQALFGSALIALSRYKNRSNLILMSIGVAIGIANLFVLKDRFTMTWALVVGITLFWLGEKCTKEWAHFIVLLLAVQTVLNVAADMQTVLAHSVGLLPGIRQSDATHVAELTGVPPLVWALLWCTIALGSLTAALLLRRQPKSPPVQHELSTEGTCT